MSATTPIASDIARMQRASFLVAAVAGVLLLIGALVDFQRFLQAYLVGYLMWLGPTLGSLAIVMLHNMTGGKWGFAIRRLLEAGMRNVPLMAVLFLPLLLGVTQLYEWAHVEHDPIIEAKRAYLNVPFFALRALIFFAVWYGLSTAMLRLAEKYDRTLSIPALRKLKGYSGLGLVAYVMTMSFASFDWGMSLEPHWFSTIYGVHFVVGQVLSTLCLAIVAASRLKRVEPFSRWLERSHFHDLGNLLLAFVMLWAYISFSQFLIIWSGNLPEETPWYLNRLGFGWQTFAMILVLGHFAAPFVILLLRRSKRNARVLATLAMALFALRFVDYYWLLAPAFHHGEFHPSWMDAVAPIGVGALWMGMFLRNTRGRPLVSLQDSKLLQQLEEAPSAG